MAFFNNDDEENQNAQGMNSQKPVQDGTAPTQLSNGVSGASSSAPVATGQQAQAASAPKATSSGMTGFQNYQKANQGTATDRLAGAATGNVNNLANQAKTNINQATTAFGQKVEQGTIANKDNAVNDVKSAVDAARKLTAGSNLGQDQTSRFQEVINAKYQGPESMRQSGDYNKASEATSNAQTAINNTQNAQGRENLLRNMYSQNGNYTQGLNKLDAGILNASQPGVQNLQQAAKSQGNIQQHLDNAEINSANLAQNRTNEINQIRTDARDAFTQGKTAEEKATEDRLTAMTTAPVLDASGNPVKKADGTVLTQWEQLPQYFKDIIANKSTANAAIKSNIAASIPTMDNQLQSSYNAANKSVTDSQNAYNHALATLQNLQTRTNVTSIFGNSLFQNEAQRQQKLKEVQAQLPALQAAIQQSQAALSPIQQQYAAKQAEINSQKSALDNLNPNAINFNSAEAAILGLNNGEGLYNLGADAIKVGTADKARLISKDEQARQAALASLGGLDKQGLLDTSLKYADASKAGTQSALDALDLKGIRNQLNQSEDAFQDYANNADLTGYGMKKNKTSGKKYYAQENANLGDLLKNAGYTFGETNTANTSNSDILKALSRVGDSTDLSPTTAAQDVLEPIANTSANLTGTTIGTDIGSGVLDLINKTNPVSNAITNIAAKNPNLLNAIAGNYLLGPVGGIAGALGIGSIFGGGSSSKESKADAAQFAHNDLNNKIQNALDTSGFKNRVNVANNDTTNARLTQLQQLLANLDKTNS